MLVYNIMKKRFKGIKFVIDIIESKKLRTVPNGTVFKSERKLSVSKFLRLRKVIFCERDLGSDALRMENTSEWSLCADLPLQ